MSYLAKNFAYSTLASPITDVATSLTVAAGHGDRFPAITAPDYTKVVIEDGSGNREIIHLTARTLGSDVFTTIVRAQEGTSARNWSSGVSVELRQTADLVQTAMGHPVETSAAHAATAISNTPAGNISATTVQAALDSIEPLVQTQSATRFTASGLVNVLAGTLSPVIASYAAGQRVTCTPNLANTTATPTLNLNTLGAKTIKKRDASGAKVALVAGDYNASGPFDFEYDGTDFILLNPTFVAAGAAGNILTSDGVKWVSSEPTPEVIQIVEASYSTASSTASNILFDSTVPQSGEGAQILSASITPTNLSNRLRIEVDLPMIDADGLTAAIAALFHELSSNALATAVVVFPAAAYTTNMSFSHEMEAGITTAKTFTVNIGASAGTMYVNRRSTGATLGGATAARLRITEIKS